jgi:hypothetical protein
VDQGDQVSVDASNNVYMTGVFSSTNVLIGSSSLTNDSSVLGHYNAFLAKFDAAGKPVWAQALYGVNGYARNVKPGFDGVGNVVLTSICEKPLTFGEATLAAKPGEIFAAKFHSKGKVLWLKDIGGNCNMSFLSSVDASGSILFAGNPQGQTMTFGRNELTCPDGFIAKLDTNGKVLWAKAAPYGANIFADPNGNAYLSGNGFLSTNINLSGLKLTCPVDHMSYIAKYDSIGNILWATRMYDIQEDSPYVVAISGDRWGNIYLGGTFNGSTIFGGMSVKSLNTNESFLARLDVLH